MTTELKWTVMPAPTGKYRSFEKRGWPMADFNGEGQHAAVALYCDDDYKPARVKTGEHKPIVIRIASYNRDRADGQAAFTWRTLSQRAATLQEAKEVAQFWWDRNFDKHGPNMVSQRG